MRPATLRPQVAMVLATMVLFLVMLQLNDWLFRRFEFLPGINWIYLPAGTRLLCTLLFAEAGAVGLLLVSWLVSFLWFFPGQVERPLVGGMLATVAPYLVYRWAQYRYGLGASLANLTPARLMVLILAYSIASPLLHHVYFALRGGEDLLRGFAVMFVGDLSGTLIVIYSMKAMLSLVPRRT